MIKKTKFGGASVLASRRNSDLDGALAARGDARPTCFAKTYEQPYQKNYFRRTIGR